MARNVYRVVPSGDSWNVTYEQSVVSYHYNKDNAVAKAVSLAKANRPSQVVVHRGNGTIELEWTYGNDPVRYPG